MQGQAPLVLLDPILLRNWVWLPEQLVWDTWRLSSWRLPLNLPIMKSVVNRELNTKTFVGFFWEVKRISL